jgi:hypothetical protein
MMLAWGTVMTLMGIVKDFHGLTGARAAVSQLRQPFEERSRTDMTPQAWGRRSWLLPGQYLPSDHLVQATRASRSYGRLL